VSCGAVQELLEDKEDMRSGILSADRRRGAAEPLFVNEQTNEKHDAKTEKDELPHDSEVVVLRAGFGSRHESVKLFFGERSHKTWRVNTRRKMLSNRGLDQEETGQDKSQQKLEGGSELVHFWLYFLSYDTGQRSWSFSQSGESTPRLKEEGRKMREERERMAKEAQTKASETSNPPASAPADEAPPLGPLDTTIRLKYTLASQPSLTTSTAVCSLLAPFGALDAGSAVLSLKPPAKPKRAVVLVPFDKVVAAFAAVGASGRKEHGLEGVEITWAGGAEPELIGWLRKTGKLGTVGSNSSSSSTPAAKRPETSNGAARSDEQKTQGASPFFFASGGTDGFSSFPSTSPDMDARPTGPSTPIGGIDLESLTLLRMRQAERERLERELLEQEATEG